MADVKISEMAADASVTGVELVPVSDGGSPKSMTVTNIKDFIIDQIEAIGAAGSVSGSDSIFILTGGVLKPADIDLIAQHAIDTIWGKAAESAPDSADILALKDGGTTEKTVTLALLAEYVRATIEAAILNVSDLADGSGALASADYFLVTQGTTGKRVQLSDISTAIYAALDTYVNALAAVTVSATADVFYCIQGGTEKKVTLAEIATYIGALYNVPASTSVNGIPQWTNATGGLKDGLALVTEVGVAGSDDNLPSEQGVREALSSVVYDQTDIGADLVDADTIVVDDGAAGTTQRKSALSRVWTYVTGKIQGLSAKATPVAADILMIQDTADSNALKELTLTNLLKVTGDISAIDLDGGTDIGADLVDADLVLVDDGAGGTNRKSAVSRFWTYVTGKIQGLSAKATPVVADILTIQDSADSNALKELTLTNLLKVTGDISAIDLDGGTDIGENLDDADLVLVDNGAGGTNRKSALSRLWTYIDIKLQATSDLGEDLVDADTFYVANDSGAPGGTVVGSAASRLWTYVTGKIQGLSAKATPVVADILTIQDSADSNALKELTLTNLLKIVGEEDITLANTKDLLCATEFASEIGSEATPFGDAYLGDRLRQYGVAAIPRFNQYRQNGTWAVPTKILSGDYLGVWENVGYHGAGAYSQGCMIAPKATVDWNAANTRGCEWEVWTSPNTGAIREIATFRQDGIFESLFGVELADGKNFIFNTTTGSKIGTATGQKIGFWNATPVVQPSHIADPAAASAITATSPGSGADGTTPNGAEWTAAVTDLGNIKTNLDALKTAVDAINSMLATAGLTASA